jgi:LysR family nitrogen assimilation transcriptional regulator
MDLRQLSNFVRIVDAGSLTRAAALIGVAQPALTFQVAKLEEELGTSLLLRNSRGVRPTEAGLILYREARSMMRHVEQIPQVIRTSTNEPTGQVTVGFPSSLAPAFATLLAATVLAKFPRIRLQLFEGESAQQRNLLATNRIEFAVMCEHIPNDEFERRELFVQRLALLCDGREADDRDGTPISFAMAAARVIALPSVGNPIRAVVNDALARNNLRVEPLVEANSMRTLIGTVRQGLGPAITIWMATNQGHDLDGLVFRPILDPQLRLSVSLNHSKFMHMTNAARVVRDALIQTVSERVASQGWVGAEVHPTAL